MRKVIELLKVCLLDTMRNWTNLLFGVLMMLAVLAITGFVLNQGTTAEIVASYSAFIVSYAAVSAVAYSITGEKEKGLYRMYRSSKLSKENYVIEKVIMASLPLILSALIIGIGVAVSDAVLSWLIAPILVLCVLSHAGIGLIFAAYFETHEDMQKIITLFLIGTMFLAPVFYTTEGLPNIVQLAQNIIPLTYGVESMREVMVQGSNLGVIWKDMALLSVLSVLTMSLGYRKLEF